MTKSPRKNGDGPAGRVRMWCTFQFSHTICLVPRRCHPISLFWFSHRSDIDVIDAQCFITDNMDRVKRIWYLSPMPMRAAKVQASLRIRAVSPEPPLLAHTSSESRGTFRQKARSLAPLNGWACAVTICHDEMLEDTNSLDGAHMIYCFALLQQFIDNIRSTYRLIRFSLELNAILQRSYRI